MSLFLAAEKPASNRATAQGNSRYLLRLGHKGVPAVLAAALLLSVAGSISASRVHFDLNPLRLQSKDSESVYWEKVTVEKSDHSILSAAVLTDSPEKVISESAKFKALPTVANVDNVFTLLPHDQEQKLPVLRSIALLIPDIKPSVARLSEEPDRLNVDRKADLGADPSYKADLIEILQRIRFKMQDQQAEKWGAAKPLVGQMVKVRESIDSIVQSLDNSPEALREAFGIPPAV